MACASIGPDLVNLGNRSLMLSGLFLALVTTIVLVPTGVSASGDDCLGHGEGNGSYVGVGMTCTRNPASVTASITSTDEDARPVYVAYRWLSVCAGSSFTEQPSIQSDCGAAHVCADPSDRLYRLWGRLESGAWVALGAQCLGAPPDEEQAPRPRVTPALVLNEIRRIGLPSLQARTQPEGKTLVNFDTIFYTEAQAFSTTVTLLGRQVDIVAEPTSYTWHHGDDTSTTTSTPGEPYPSRQITYRYSDAGTTVRPRVDVTYTARFRVNRGDWQAIDETVTISGPEGTLRIAQAQAALSGNYG
jgi:hypothetical protein